MRRKTSVKRVLKMNEEMDQNGEMVYSRKDANEDVSKYKFEDYKIMRHVGKGTFGKVYLV